MNIVILAAGAGKRMQSTMPKVLHPLAGKAMLQHVIDTAKQLKPSKIIIVVGHGAEQIKQAISEPQVEFVYQAEQLGTGHAVQQALPLLAPDQPTLILFGDVPLIQKNSLEHLLQQANQNALGLMTLSIDQPSGYGRIIRNQAHQVIRIVEEKDANAEEKNIHEINTGIMLAPTALLTAGLKQLNNHNAQGEYYLTDLVSYAISQHTPIVTHSPTFEWEVSGVNNKAQLAALERAFQLYQAQQLLEKGIHLMDPNRIDIRGQLQCGKEVSIDVNCIFEGQVTLGDNVQIGANCIIRDTHIASGARIAPFTYIEQAQIDKHASVGPYARIRPGTKLAQNTHIGNFVEVKNSEIGEYSKANHLSYIGNAQIGQHVNIGAGTITCNYDGANKHLTKIGDHVFVGSDCQLVAPVHIENGATIAAGTTIWKDVRANHLALNTKTQDERTDYVRPKKSSS